MSETEETRSVVLGYHRGWTGGRYEDAARLLASDVRVEVPVNDYPTAESFAEALAGFGPLVARVDLLAEFAQESEAMLLYDAEVKGLGKMRVAEHFTVTEGRISRLRQIHDTAGLREAGFVRGN